MATRAILMLPRQATNVMLNQLQVRHLPNSVPTSSEIGEKILKRDADNKASPEQLNYVADQMSFYLPRFFGKPHPFDLYTKDVIFIDNIRSLRIQGVYQYASRVALVKLYHSLNYTNSRVELLNLVKLPEESCIKIRWRVVSKPGLIHFLIYIYKYHSMEIWKDGISTMYVNKGGKIFCHICDNIEIEKDETKVKKVVKNPLVDKGLNV